MKFTQAVLAGLLTAMAAPALAINEGVETGDLFGISLSFRGGGHANVVTSVAGNATTYAPAHGRYFQDLRAPNAGSLAGTQQFYNFRAGDRLTGYAAFVSRDALPTEVTAQVIVKTGHSVFGGTVVATPFTASVASTGANTDGPWTPWSFTAPADGPYTVEFRITNTGSTASNSHALFDADEIDIDIKPGSTSNAINPAGPGVFPVAILSTPGFDARNIDRATIRFGESGGNTSGYSFYRDIDSDGDTDVVAVFKTSRTQILCWSEHAFLTAKLASGLLVSGSDTVTPVGSSCP